MGLTIYEFAKRYYEKEKGMSLNVGEVIEVLSVNMRTALEHDKVELAESINDKINKLIEYSTGVK